MNWENTTIKAKISIGMGILVFLIIVLAIYSYSGVSGIVSDAKEVIAGNRLDSEMTQREVDHLKWAKSLNAYLTDKNIKELNIQLDPTKCALGKWLYGQERENAEKLIPAIVPLLKEIEEPHKQLHQSARKISEVMRNVDDSLGEFLLAREIDHLMWAQGVSSAILGRKKDLDVQLDYHECSLGKWFYSPETKKVFGSNEELGAILGNIDKPHIGLHESAKKIKAALVDGNFDKANDIFAMETIQCLKEVQDVLKKGVQ